MVREMGEMEESPILTSQAFFDFAQSKAKVEPVDVPELGGRVYVRRMGAEDRDRFDRVVSGDEKVPGGTRALLLVLTVCDANGKRLFLDGQANRLGPIDWIAIDPIITASVKLNKIGRDALEDAEKNSDETPADDSSSN